MGQSTGTLDSSSEGLPAAFLSLHLPRASGSMRVDPVPEEGVPLCVARDSRPALQGGYLYVR